MKIVPSKAAGGKCTKQIHDSKTNNWKQQLYPAKCNNITSINLITLIDGYYNTPLLHWQDLLIKYCVFHIENPCEKKTVTHKLINFSVTQMLLNCNSIQPLFCK